MTCREISNTLALCILEEDHEGEHRHSHTLSPAQLEAVAAYKESAMELMAWEKAHAALQATWKERLVAMNVAFADSAEPIS